MSLGTTRDQEQRDIPGAGTDATVYLSEANMEGYVHHKLLAIRGFNTTTNKSMRREYQLTTQ